MRQDENNRWVSDDGHWVWDGAAWQPTTEPPSNPPESAASEMEAAGDTPPADAVSTSQQPDPTHPLSPDGTQVWSGQDWVPYQASAPTTGGMEDGAEVEPEAALPVPPSDHPISQDGHWKWDGTVWQPIETPGGPENVETRQLSPDGRWAWDGTSWQAVDSVVAATTVAGAPDAAAAALIASGMALSADGRWVWNGKDWQQTGR